MNALRRTGKRRRISSTVVNELRAAVEAERDEDRDDTYGQAKAVKEAVNEWENGSDGKPHFRT